MIETDELAKYEIFQDLALDELSQVNPCCEIVHSKADRVIFTEGDLATHLYLVKEGRLAIQIQVDSEHKVNVFTASPGKSVGWSALVAPYKMTASCIALETSILIKVDGERLRKLCEEDHHLGYQVFRYLTKVIFGRLRDTRTELSNLIYWVRQ